ncbi:MAG TPA: efflux RND transporter permease subunit [Gemmataceae bacterium]|nr:efflux RND transporter permease subunit [Gemmataceae bacterium]
MFSKFFINRPIAASVMSIIITLGGFIAVWQLPIAQYPDITPPTVEVSAVYPGANAQVVADTVAAPIEQQVNGVENMMYMSSQCTNDGNYTLTVTFKHGVDLNMAQVLVENRVALAQPILPDLVKRRGVTTKKKSPSVLMIVNLWSPDGSRDNLYLSNYATIQLKDELSRLPGVGDIAYLGKRDYSMRVWLDPTKMASRNLSAGQITRAIEEQNTQVAAGQIGQPPVLSGQVFQYTMSTMGRLMNPEQFANIVVYNDGQGRLVRLRDVVVDDRKDENGKYVQRGVEMGALEYNQTCTLDRKPSVALSIYQLPGSNALNVAKEVKDKMAELRERFPEGMNYKIVYDTTPFIYESIKEVFKTLRDAIILVAIVVLLFLQNWRSAIIPLVAVPVAIIGTFAVMIAIGFSLNTLTLFGLVLAIGIVVDDAIVVVEAVEHHIEHGLSPKEATIRAMEQVSGPVIAIGLVLSAVFVPCAFISGITGQFYRQFALTIAISTLISAFNSLTLSPALTALLLRPRDKGSAPPLPRLAFALAGAAAGAWYLSTWLTHWLERGMEHLPPHYTAELHPHSVPIAVGILIAAGGIVGWFVGRPLNWVLGGSFRAFNVAFGVATNVYTRMVGLLLRVSILVLLVYGGLVALTYFGFVRTPKGFIPVQDKGYLLVNVQLPDSASAERTQQVVSQIEELASKDPGVEHTVAIAGQSILLNANAPNFGAMYVMLKDFHRRESEELSGDAIAARLQSVLRDHIPDARVNVFGAPPIDGLGTAGGFKIVVEDRGDTGLPALQAEAEKRIHLGEQTPGLQGLYTSFRANTPWLYLDIDRTQAKVHGVPISEIFNTLQFYLGSYYVNDFNRFGRTWQVNIQAAPVYRRQIDDLKQIRIPNMWGKLVPLAGLLRVREEPGPVLIMRYNMYPSAAINGNPANGISSGQAIELMEEIANKDLPRAMRPEWTELALLQLQTGNTAMWVFLLAVVLVFLVLAAQYESTSLPLAVILVVPMCLLCSIAGVLMGRMDINIFTQVGFVVLIGLACKNAILIVEFAKAQRESGNDRFSSTLAACKLRLRPIIMTSFAFILGVLPLVIAEGAGAEMRRLLGTAVFAGMLGVTLFGIFLTPVFYYVIQWFNDRLMKDEAAPEVDETREVVVALAHASSNGDGPHGALVGSGHAARHPNH